MPFHWCIEEQLMLMSMIPFIGIAFRKLHMWYVIKFGHKFGHKCHEKTCDDKHVEHN